MKKSLIKIIWKVHSYKNNLNTFEPKNVQFPDSSSEKLLTVTLTKQTQIKRLGKNKKINSGKKQLTHFRAILRVASRVKPGCDLANLVQN